MSTAIYINGVKVFPLPYSNGFYIEQGKGLISFKSLDEVKRYLERGAVAGSVVSKQAVNK
jgi:hypothetical protein